MKKCFIILLCVVSVLGSVLLTSCAQLEEPSKSDQQPSEHITQVVENEDIMYFSQLKVRNDFVKAMNTEYAENVTTQQVKGLYDANGNVYTLLEFEPSGYMIYIEDARMPVEYSADAPSPYKNFINNLWYFGPQNYYVEMEDTLYHTITGSVLDKSSINTLKNTNQLLHDSYLIKEEGVIACSTTQTLNGTSYTCVDNSQYFVNMRDVYSDMLSLGDGCGYNAAAILLGWYDTFYDDSFVNNAYMTSRSLGVNRTFTDIGNNRSLAHLLWESTGRPSTSTTSTVIRQCLNDYFNANNINAGSYDMIVPFFSGADIKKQIQNNNRPVIIFGDLQNHSGSGNVAHAAVIYGYARNGYGVNTWGFLANYGWAGYTKVTINVTAYSTFGSMYYIT